MTRVETRALHDEAEALLPWYLNGSLDAGERGSVERHLGTCLPCREALDELRLVRVAVHAADPGPWVPSSHRLTRLLERIGAGPAAEPDPGSSGRDARGSWRRVGGGIGPGRPGRALVLSQAIAIAVLVGLLLGPGRPGPPVEPARFETLTSRANAGSDPGPRIQVLFDEQASLREVHAVLRRVGASTLSGPSRLGVYTLAVGPGASREEVLGELRSDPCIALAEWLDGPSSPGPEARSYAPEEASPRGRPREPQATHPTPSRAITDGSGTSTKSRR